MPSTRQAKAGDRAEARIGRIDDANHLQNALVDEPHVAKASCLGRETDFRAELSERSAPVLLQQRDQLTICFVDQTTSHSPLG
jgi:hypothetical protein